jgi:hypothetical protein
MWSGDRFNRRRARADKVRIPIDHDVLRDGALGADGIWRQIVTVFDAIAKGFDLVDLPNCNAKIRSTSSTTCSAACSSTTARACSPSRSCAAAWSTAGTSGAMSSPMPRSPTRARSGWAMIPMPARRARATMPRWWPSPRRWRRRALPRAGKKRLKGLQFDQQAAAIREMAGRYRVTRIAIDVTGAGRAVEQLVRKWFPLVTAITYSPLSKSQMVLKAKNVISAGRLEFDAGWMDMMSAFMAIRPEITKNGITYVAGRAGAWAMPTWPGR